MNYWRYIEEDKVPGSYGLAGDEYIMSTYKNKLKYPVILRLYTYRSYSAFVGRFQDIERELNMNRCKELNIEINRRPTGGGAIIMGEDQLGLSLVTYNPAPVYPHEIFSLYSSGIIRGLNFLNIYGALKGKNDIEVGGKKIAGLGIYVDDSGILLFHASILVDIDLGLMIDILRFSFDKVKDKGIFSYEDRITTLSRELGYKIGVERVRAFIKKGFQEAFEISFIDEPFSEKEKEKIRSIEKNKYLKREWIYNGEPILS
jgi:lipoate-protein ligase A